MSVYQINDWRYQEEKQEEKKRADIKGNMNE